LPYILIKDVHFKVPTSYILYYILLYLNYGQVLCPFSIVNNILNFKSQYFWSSLKLYALYVELELDHFGYNYFILFLLSELPICSLPFLLFINNFGTHHNMYCALKGYYIIPAGLLYYKYRRLGNLFTLTLRPYGTDMADALPFFQNSFYDLAKGIIMLINGINMIITTGILAFIGDMP
jgi:hypothetical protein